MIIKLKKTYDLNLRTNKHFEKVSEKLILLNITFEGDAIKFESRPIHKRYDFGDFPPLDISFDSETGLLKEVTIFINAANILSYCEIEQSSLLNQTGYPCFNFDMSEKHEYYYDKVCQIKISVIESSLVVWKLDEIVNKKITINREINIFLNNEDEFVGFVLNGLSNDELQLLKG